MIIDFCTTDIKTLKQVGKAVHRFAPSTIQRLVGAFREYEDTQRETVRRVGGVMEDGAMVVELVDNVKMTLWSTIIKSVSYYFVSFELASADSFELLRICFDVMQLTERRDFPIKINKGEAFTVKAVAAIAAMAVAQGCVDPFSGDAGIMWDMARDRLI